MACVMLLHGQFAYPTDGGFFALTKTVISQVNAVCFLFCLFLFFLGCCHLYNICTCVCITVTVYTCIYKLY